MAGDGDVQLPHPLAFDWDDGNSEKNWDRHRVRRSECEEAFLVPPLLVVNDPSHSHAEARFLGLGRSAAGRLLCLSFTLRGNRIRIISARDMSRKERQSYEQANREEDPEVS